MELGFSAWAAVARAVLQWCLKGTDECCRSCLMLLL